MRILLVLLTVGMLCSCTKEKKYILPEPQPNNSIKEVYFTQDTLKLTEGETKKIILRTVPVVDNYDDFNFKSLDNEIAYISSTGLVKAEKAGKTNLKVWLPSVGIEDMCSVVVSKDENTEDDDIIDNPDDDDQEDDDDDDIVDPPIDDTKIILSPENIIVRVGETQTIECKIESELYNEQDIKWTIEPVNNDFIIFSESDKTIHGIHYSGNNTISIKANVGNASDVCTVSVAKPLATDVSFTVENTLLQVGETSSFEMGLIPMDAEYEELIVESKSNNVIQVIGSKIKAVSKGSTEVICRTADSRIIKSVKVTVMGSPFKENISYETKYGLEVKITNLSKYKQGSYKYIEFDVCFKNIADNSVKIPTLKMSCYPEYKTEIKERKSENDVYDTYFTNTLSPDEVVYKHCRVSAYENRTFETLTLLFENLAIIYNDEGYEPYWDMNY